MQTFGMAKKKKPDLKVVGGRDAPKPKKRAAKKKGGGGGAGRPPIDFDAQTRAKVQAMAAVGLTQEQIRLLIINPTTGQPITKKTLIKKFKRDMDRGRANAILRVGTTVYQMACGQDAEFDADGNLLRPYVPPDRAAAFFYLKTQAGWRETEARKEDDPPEDPNKVDRDIVQAARDKIIGQLAAKAS